MTRRNAPENIDHTEYTLNKIGPGDSFTPDIRLQAHTKLINESGLYSLILRSKLPSAKVFKKWITSDVLPSIRKKAPTLYNNLLILFYKDLCVN